MKCGVEEPGCQVMTIANALKRRKSEWSMSVFRVGATRLLSLHPLINAANRTLVPCAPLRAGRLRRPSRAICGCSYGSQPPQRKRRMSWDRCSRATCRECDAGRDAWGWSDVRRAAPSLISGGASRQLPRCLRLECGKAADKARAHIPVFRAASMSLQQRLDQKGYIRLEPRAIASCARGEFTMRADTTRNIEYVWKGA
jgi:hypothetical protein